jgi:hypothetical protein
MVGWKRVYVHDCIYEYCSVLFGFQFHTIIIITISFTPLKIKPENKYVILKYYVNICMGVNIYNNSVNGLYWYRTEVHYFKKMPKTFKRTDHEQRVFVTWKKKSGSLLTSVRYQYNPLTELLYIRSNQK